MTVTDPNSGSGINVRLNDLVAVLAADINALTQCNNDARAAIVASITDTEAQLHAIINDAATSGAASTWSTDKIIAYVASQIGGLTPAVIAELQSLASEGAQLAAIMTAVAGSVRFDVDQTATITSDQATVARTNIGAVSSNDVVNIVTAMGLTTPEPGFNDVDLASAYLAARTVVCD